MTASNVRTIYISREFRGDNGIVGRLEAWGPQNGRQKFVVEENGFKERRGRLYTAERPWRDNQPNVSCIPWGDHYTLERRAFGGFAARMKKRFGHPFVPWIRGCEPARTAILFHPGNDPETDSEGCILPGLSWNRYEGKVGSSADAHRALMETLMRVPDENWPLKLIIVDHSGPCNAA